ncbi:hypothetical protein DY000_02000577 [Brassica cretica]|uniref:Alpha/beta hydrolase fold-3 domain-containing protein n=1 Tax=Brassica cretica TaxID=69181 RepID=A0ABQ7BWT1_BRACR|nr:hypothetical protein DY000_02000577 [Brassica cretica]
MAICPLPPPDPSGAATPASRPAGRFILLIARFINACDAVQIRLASEKCNLESLPQSRRQTLIPSTPSSFSRWPLESRLRFKRAASSSLFVCLGSMGLKCNLVLSLCVVIFRVMMMMPYIDVGMRYNDWKISELEAVVVANSSDFEKDKNLGLVKQAVSSLYKRNILRLTQKYWTLSLQDIANMVQLANAKEAEMVLYLLYPGWSDTCPYQPERWNGQIEQYKTSEMIEIVDSVIQRTIGLSKNLIAMDESLSCDPLYLGKVGRERQRYDFGDDFDTVPQKFSICVLLGVSCGGNIADYVARKAVEAGKLLDPVKVVAQVLMYPFFIGNNPTQSEIKLANSYFYDKPVSVLAWKLFLPEKEFDFDHPAANPLAHNRSGPPLKLMPPTLTVVAEHDWMRDRAIAYAEELRKVNVDSPVLEYKDAVHEFATLDMLLKTPQAQACAEDIAIWVKKYISLRGHEFSY